MREDLKSWPPPSSQRMSFACVNFASSKFAFSSLASSRRTCRLRLRLERPLKDVVVSDIWYRRNDGYKESKYNYTVTER